MSRLRIKKRKHPFLYFYRIVLHVMLGLGAIVFIFPFIWMLLSSLMTNQEITASPITLFPGSFFLGNFKTVFEEIPIGRAWFNSLFTSGLVTFFVLFTSSLSGYMFAKMRFRGNNSLFTLVLSSLLFPTHVVLIPLFLIVSRMKLIDSYIGIILPFLISGFGVFLLRQFIYGIPTELIEAARIDGASDWRIYFRVIIPLVKPAIAVVGILTFLWTYDEFLWPLVVVNKTEMMTLPLILGRYAMAEGGVVAGASMATTTLVLAPVLIVYVFFQRFFVKGISMTGMKG